VGLLGSESTITTVPGWLPTVVGVKSMYTTQLPDAVKLLPHVELGSVLYSGSEYVQLVKVIVEEPVFVRVNVPFALPVAPTVTVPILKLVAENFNVGAALPTPAKVMVVGLVGSESMITSVPGWLPAAVGVKSMYTTQLPDAARLLLQVELGSVWYSGSEYVQLVKVIVEEPVFVRVNVPFALPVVPTVTVPKLKLFAENVSPTKAALPIPVKLMVVGLLGSESTIVSVPERVPAAVGVKAMDNTQLLDAARLLPQVELGSV
jgi:hypothetical protein